MLDVRPLHFVQAGSLKRHTHAQKGETALRERRVDANGNLSGCRVQRKFAHLPESDSWRRGSRSLNRRLPTILLPLPLADQPDPVFILSVCCPTGVAAQSSRCVKRGRGLQPRSPFLFLILAWRQELLQ